MNNLWTPRTQLLLVRITFAACLAMLVGNVLRFAINLSTLDPANPRLDHAQRALGSMHQLLRMVIDAETAERVYLLSGDRARLGSYRVARDQYGEILTAVAMQLSDDASQLVSLLRLRALIHARFDELERSIAAYDGRLPDRTLSRGEADRPGAIVHRIQAVVDDMEARQVRPFASRDLQSSAFVWTTLLAGLIVNAFVIALLIRLYSMIQPGLPVALVLAETTRNPSRQILRVTTLGQVDLTR
jgi:CHASE3 domain sensor protein